jgi:hypothetical protein
MNGVSALLLCDWGRLVCLPSETERCHKNAVQRVALHGDEGLEYLLQLCDEHAALVKTHTNPHVKS